MKKEEPKRLSPKDQHLVDYILSHPELSETACIMACGWAEGSVTKIIARVRSAVDARKAQNSAKVDKTIVRDVTVGRKEVISELWDMARAWRGAFGGLQPAHVKAADSLADIFGMKVKQVRDVTKVFEGWTDDELDAYARTGELPQRIAGSSSGSPTIN